MTRLDHAVVAGAAVAAVSAGGREPASREPALRVRNLAVRHRQADGSVVAALDGVSFEVDPGQLVALVGPPECGKSTLLRAVAGLEVPDAGMVEAGGRLCSDAASGRHLPPDRRAVRLVFPTDALWPHLTVLQNVVYPLRAGGHDGLDPADADTAARRVLGRVGLAELVDERPHRMGARPRQRVALARALVAGADVVLVDEPRPGTDPCTRAALRADLAELQRDLGFAAVYVSGDRPEALELAHRVVVMEAGGIVQAGPPQAVYDDPVSRRVASFIGSTNELEGEVVGLDPVRVLTDLGEVTGRSGAVPLAVGDAVVALWRPERTDLVPEEPAGPNRWPVTVEASLFLGAHTQQAARVAGHRFLVWQGAAGPERCRWWMPRAGDRAWAAVAPDDVRVLPATAEN
jgi:iron(III) transport system ATP-binding protein